MANHKEEYDSPHHHATTDSDPELGNGNRLAPTSTNMTMTPEFFEKLYLQPKTRVSGELRSTFGNPTPLALMGFVVGLTPLSIEFMGWRGSGGSGVATTTASIWFGGMLLILAGIGEFLLGNTFPFLVFMGYGAHFLTFSTTFVPFFNAINYFSGTGEADLTPTFLASYAFYPMAMACLSFIYLVGSFRTNIIFVMIFTLATIGFGFASGAFFNLAVGNVAMGTRLIVGTGACFFAASILGWYLLLGIMIATMELPVPDLPVFDLSTVIKARKRGKAE